MAGDMIARVSPDEPGLVDVLVGNLKDPDGSVRVSSIHALYQLGKQAVAARPAVIESLKDPVPAVRTAAIGAVRVLGVGADEETRRLITPLLKDPDATARMAAISALHTLGMTPDEEVALLVLLLKDKQLDSNARQRVLSNLAALGPAGKAALPALVEAMKADPVLDVQAAAIRAIGHMGKAALPVIADLKALKQQPGTHPWLQETADSAIKAIERSEE
jgi:HEAT repeat protein